MASLNFNEVTTEISRRACSKRDKLCKVDTQIVLAQFFDYLNELPADEAFALVSRGMAVSAKRIVENKDGV